MITEEKNRTEGKNHGGKKITDQRSCDQPHRRVYVPTRERGLERRGDQKNHQQRKPVQIKALAKTVEATTRVNLRRTKMVEQKIKTAENNNLK